MRFSQISSDMPELRAWSPLVRASRFSPLLLVRLELRPPAHFLAFPRAFTAILGALAVAPLLLPLHSHTRVLIGAKLWSLVHFMNFLSGCNSTMSYSSVRVFYSLLQGCPYLGGSWPKNLCPKTTKGPNSKIFKFNNSLDSALMYLSLLVK